MHLFLWAEDSETELASELAQSFPGAPARAVAPALLETGFPVAAGPPLPPLAFARQWLPDARVVRAESVRGWAGVLFEAVAAALPEDRPWALHVEPCYGARAVHRIGARAWHSAGRFRKAEVVPETGPTGAGADGHSSDRDSTDRDAAQAGPVAEAGRHRCRLIREALVEVLQKKRRHLRRRLDLEPVPFTAGHSLVQLLLTAPGAGYLSVAAAPLPFEQRHLLSPFPKGQVPAASDKAAPSRALAKLVEAELRLGRRIGPGETCVDLGAAPGSWTYLAVGRGARVFAIDRSPLRADLMRHGQVRFEAGDAFRYQPRQAVDWLLCDVIAAPGRTIDLLLEWLRRRWCRRFVVTIKLGDAPGGQVLARLKGEAPGLTAEFFLTRLCANKKELCAFGSTAPGEALASDEPRAAVQ